MSFIISPLLLSYVIIVLINLKVVDFYASLNVIGLLAVLKALASFEVSVSL